MNKGYLLPTYPPTAGGLTAANSISTTYLPSHCGRLPAALTGLYPLPTYPPHRPFCTKGITVTRVEEMSECAEIRADNDSTSGNGKGCVLRKQQRRCEPAGCNNSAECLRAVSTPTSQRNGYSYSRTQLPASAARARCTCQEVQKRQAAWRSCEAHAAAMECAPAPLPWMASSRRRPIPIVDSTPLEGP